MPIIRNTVPSPDLLAAVHGALLAVMRKNDPGFVFSSDCQSPPFIHGSVVCVPGITDQISCCGPSHIRQIADGRYAVRSPGGQPELFKVFELAVPHLLEP